MTLEQARAFVEAVATADELFSCEHGHSQCSTEKGGPCLDEVLQQYPELDNS